MKDYPICIQQAHVTQLVPYAETVSVLVDTDGKSGEFKEDSTLEGRTIIGIRATIADEKGKGANENGVKLLSRDRAASATVELWGNGSTRLMSVPLSMLLNQSVDSGYMKVYMKGFSAGKSKITFGEHITATEKEAVMLTIITND